MFLFFEAPTLLEEARLIALRMRKILETPHKTGALITPDRTLARFVKTELLRWNIIVDDSGGTAFSDTTIGRYFLLSLEVLLFNIRPLTLFSLLQNPLTHLGYSPEDLKNVREILDRYVLRGITPEKGIFPLIHRLTEAHQKHCIEKDEFIKVRDFLLKFEEASSSFKDLLFQGASPGELLKAHEAFLLTLTTSSQGEKILWTHPHEKEAQDLFELYVDETQHLPPLRGKEYASFLKMLFEKNTLQLDLPEHPRLSILGLFESRLLKKDSVILGSLNEGTWPNSPSANPWMYKRLREALSLPPLETNIGVSLYDFFQGFLNQEVLLTRSKRTCVGLQKPSRSLILLSTFLKSKNYSLSLPEEADFLPYFNTPSTFDSKRIRRDRASLKKKVLYVKSSAN